MFCVRGHILRLPIYMYVYWLELTATMAIRLVYKLRFNILIFVIFLPQFVDTEGEKNLIELNNFVSLLLIRIWMYFH